MSTTQQQLPTGTYAVDKIHSSIGFGVKHNGVSTFRSTFADYDASFADGILTGTAQVASIAIEQPDLKGHVLAPDFFDAEAVPTVTFRSTDIRVDDDGRAEVDGELTIKGITKPVTATGTFEHGPGIAGADVAAFELEARIDRREYGLDWQAELPNGKDALGWDVVLTVQLELGKAA
jgi:polyisoprenoid-binding protein YceI